ncbi:hypothetical protein OK016_05060 [Vibrio chagasii]|nr:hypothetical protein [Vibrio chagasii]
MPATGGCKMTILNDTYTYLTELRQFAPDIATAQQCIALLMREKYELMQSPERKTKYT